ncbi:virulence protein [Gabonibacter chumensis]|uniref:virulence protein n=1 Tax=Gabonibacter chumensis TaxID=2972474 RepID=UPI0025735C0C|nr:virulence protein [Gabonibacter chumensis]MCR9010752.1 virulence protein [Gabonibacter chumensis]
MYAITFDLRINDLKEHYDKQPPNAYVEIKNVLKTYGFSWIQGSVYVYTNTQQNDIGLGSVFLAMEALKKIDWFVQSVRDIRAFKIEDWSNFTPIVKNK